MFWGVVVPDKKIAIVCDWLTTIGGAEKVVLALHNLYPEAPIYTSQYDSSKIDWFKDADVRTTWLQKLPKNSTFRKFLPVLRRLAFESLDLTQYDIVISSSGAEAKSVKKVKKGAIHINYCHSPTHYYWQRFDEYIKNPGFGLLNPLARLGLRILVKPMRRWDYAVAQRPDIMIANSSHIQKKIKEYYGRDSIVIYPPVDVEQFQKNAKNKKRDGLIIVGRQVPYKRFDLAISAAIKLNKKLTVVGDGPLHRDLKRQAEGHKNITFKTGLSTGQIAKLLSESELFLFPGIEDFGIAPVEALASGTPVVAYNQGGALDYVNKDTGIFFDSQKTENLITAIEKGLKSKWNYEQISRFSNNFSVILFNEAFSKLIKR